MATRRPHPLALIIAILGGSLVCCLGGTGFGLWRVKTDRDAARDAGIKAGLPARFDAYQIKVRPADDATELLIRFEKAFATAKIAPQVRARRNQAVQNESERVRFYKQLVAKHPELVRLEASIYKKTQVPFLFEPEAGIYRTAPHEDGLASLREWLSVRRIADYHEDPSPTLARLRGLSAFAQAANHDPEWLSILIASSFRRSILATLGDLLSNPKLEPHHLDEMDLLIQRLSQPSQMKRVIQNEFADILTFERQIDSGRLAKYLARDIDHTESDEEVKEAEKSARALVSVLSIPPFREAAMAYYYRFITNAWQTLTFDPDQYRKDLEYCGKLESELKSRDPSNFIATWHHFSYVNFINVNADEAARLRCLKLAMRLIRDRSNNRPFPSNVSAIPKDPFTGKPLIYRRTSQGFMLYSLGTNLKDDQLKSSPGKPRDIGVRYPASSSDIAR